ncbi:MAG: LLM class flavin-dependent oxidoreductase [Actinomycetota bacterium]|nr:LLM class flavin-dependent oxidoreductase [Actinomycetota bacterium]
MTTRPGRAAIGMCFDRNFPPSAVTEFARRLEDGGVDEMWFIEDCFFTTAPPLAAAALSVTDGLTVGLGILPAVARTAPITAMEIATLAGMGPGRVVGGIGHGIQSWMAQMGVRPASPVTALEEVIVAVKRLLAGETVNAQGGYAVLDNVRLEQPPHPVPPVVAGVRGPRSLESAGRVADGVLLDGPCSPDYVRWAHAQCSANDEFQIRCFGVMSLAATRQQAYRNTAPFLSELLGGDHPTLAKLQFYSELADLNAAKGAGGLVGMPPDWWHSIGAIGTLDDAHAYLEAMEAEGVMSISMFPAPEIDIARGQLSDVVTLANR